MTGYFEYSITTNSPGQGKAADSSPAAASFFTYPPMKPIDEGERSLRLTFLEPTEPWARTSKTYNKPNRDGLSSDYNLGKYFRYTEHQFRNLSQVADAFRDTKNKIAIYGKPLPNLSLLDNKFRRTTENFPYPGDQTLHCFDMDKWPVPESVRETRNWRLDRPATTEAVVRDLLTKEGFLILAQSSCVIVLTSSMWGTQYLNCHLYFRFTEPIRVEAMREFAVALAKVRQRTIFDQAVYKSVQPQFFTPPTCTGFSDPLEGCRIIDSEGMHPTVDTKEFQKQARKIINQAGWSVDSTARASKATLGTNWQNTITRLVGGDLGINEPCYRAAAQLVQEMGREYALSNISKLATEMYNLCWETLIKKNSDRGSNQKDKQTYQVSRFRQYIQSACDKPFGREVDQLTNTVRKAIAEAENGKKEMLVSKPVLQALVKLKYKHLNKFVLLDEEIKSKKLVSKSNFNRLLRHSHNSLSAVDPEKGTPGGELLSDKPPKEESRIDEVLNAYEYIEDQFGNKFAAVPGNGDGGYHMMRVNGDLVHVFYRDGLKLTGNTCSAIFGKKVFSKLVGEMHRADKNRFSPHLVGRRIVAEAQGPSAPSWVNLGLQPNGKHLVLRIATDGLRLLTAKDAPVKWTKGTEPMSMATDEQILKRFSDSDDLTEYLLETLPRFIAVDTDSIYRVILWSVAVLADRPLSYIAEFIGGAGTGKSTAADFLKDLLDPSGYQLGTGADRSFVSKNRDDFIADLDRRHITILDNQSKLSAAMQDELCMIATGMRKNQRRLYTDTQDDLFIRKPLIITGLDTVITRPDLRTRAVQILFRKMPYNGNLFEEWGREKPFLLAAMAQVTCRTMALYAQVSTPPKDISSRDIFLACVKGAVKGNSEPDYQYVRDYRMREAADQINEVSFLSLFVIFLDDVHREDKDFEITTVKLHRQMKKWAFKRAGEELNDRVINPIDLPETTRGMGWELAKNIELISRVSTRWEYAGKRADRTRTVHMFKRKEKNNKVLDSLL